MAQPLTACLAIILAFQASAQPGRANPQELKTELTRGFARAADVSTLDFSGQAAPLVLLFEQVKYVQAGREPGDEKETYVAFIRSVAERLGIRADPAVEIYKDRMRPARAVAAPRREIDARTAIAEDVRHNPILSVATKTRLTRNLRETSESLTRDLKGNANFIGGPTERPAELAAAGAAAPDVAVYHSKGERNWNTTPPQVQPVPLITRPVPPPVSAPAPRGLAASGTHSWASLRSHFDWKRGKTVAAEAYWGTLASGMKCYNKVKQALIKAGVMKVPNPQSTLLIGLRPDAAAMFSEDVARNPNILDAMDYRQVDLAHASDDPASVPDGSLLIYAAACSWANADYGHAELTVGEDTYASLRAQNTNLRELKVAANELRVCHFECKKRSMPFLRSWGKQGCLKMYVPVVKLGARPLRPRLIRFSNRRGGPP